MQYVQFGILGLATGSLYGLVALGVVLSYRASGVLNFSAGAVGAVGAFVTYGLRDDKHVAWPLAVIVGLLVGAALGALTQVLIMEVLRRASLLTKLVATLGVLSLAQGVITLAWPSSQNSQVARLPASLLPHGPSALVHLFGIQKLPITKDRLIIIGIVIVLAAALRWVYSKTLFGLATSAVAENAQAAAAGGLSTRTIELTNFTLAGVLAAGAAILLAPIIGLGAATLTLIIVPAVAAALLGKFSSFSMTLAGAAVIGILQTEITRFVTNPHLTGLPDAIPVLLIVAFTVVGGRSRLARGEIISRLPLPGTGRVSIGRVLAGFIVVAAFAILVNNSWAAAVATLMATAVLVLSMVVVTGYGGQLSLGQAALAGFGAWLTARFFLWGIPFVPALILAVLATVPAGLVVALPALRTRGVTLAVATLALGSLIFSMVLNNSTLTGGFTGLVIENESVFGINVDAVAHPHRYAVLTLVGFVVAGLIVANVRRGRAGRRLLAVRGNERAAAALGIGVYGAKLYAFGVAAAIAALGGVLLAFQANFLDLSQFQVLTSITTVEYSVIGGVGWIGGAVIGAFGAPGALIAHLFTSVFDINNWVLPLAGLITILVIAQAPDGVAANMAAELVRKPRSALSRLMRLFDRLGVIGAKEGPVVARRDRAALPVEVRGLTVRFGGVTALNDVSFEVRPGEVLGLIGPNGAGKTTLLDAVTGFTRPAAGSVLFGGTPIDTWSPERRARAGIGRSWQGVELFDGLSVRDNLLVAADDQSRWRYLLDLIHPGRLPRSQIVDEVVDILQLGDILDQQPSALPQGRARLVGIARAMAAEPAVLLLDEPAAGLDTHETQEFAAVIRMLADRMGMGVVVIEHDVPLVTSTCDRIVVLDFGHQIAVGTPAEIVGNTDVIGAYLGAEPAASTATDAGMAPDDLAAPRATSMENHT